MKKIKNLVHMIDEELEGAKCYAERYVEYKAEGDSTWSGKFKDMANDELRHASTIHDLVVKEIETISKVFIPPAEMEEKWNRAHVEYVEKAAWIKQMLAM